MALQPNIGALAGAQSPIQTDPDPSPEGVAARKQKWSEFFANPQVQAALLQFGVSALQPKAPGQSTAGALASAVGQGAEAATRVGTAQRTQEQQRLESEREGTRLGLEERRTTATEATAAAGTSRAATAATAAGTAQRRLDAQISQFSDRMRQELNIARGSARDKIWLGLIKTEQASVDASFGEKTFDMNAVIQKFFELAPAREGKPATTDPSSSLVDILADNLQQFSPEEQESRIAAQEKSGILSPEQGAQVRAKLALGQATVAEAVEGEGVKPGSDIEERLSALSASAAPTGRKASGAGSAGRTQADIVEEKEGGVAEMQSIFPGGVEGVTREGFNRMRRDRRLQQIFNEAFGPGSFEELRKRMVPQGRKR